MTWHSQAGQDEWAHSLVWGYFVDVGAHDGIVHSNTFALERAGWHGVCIEPNDEAFNQLTRNRPGSLHVNWIISDGEGLIPFDGTRVGSGDLRQRATLAEVLDTIHAPDIIDYLSIDVEGHEIQVLAGMDFDRWHVQLITIEHNLYSDGPVRKDAIFDVLTGHGFERVREDVVAEGYGPYEDWYVHG